MWPSGKPHEVGKQKNLGSILLRLSFLFKKAVVQYGHCVATLFLTINETLKWLSSLPMLMQDRVILVGTV